MPLDLNLLTALDALLEEGSVVGAADRLHLTPPAMSRALSRIRRVMDDQILVRTGRTMTPTPRALAVREQVHALVEQAQSLLAPEHELDLSTLERTFTLKWHDSVTTAIGPTLLTAVRQQAPGVRLRLLAEAATDGNDLRQGRVDLEIGATPPTLPDIRSDTVVHDRPAAVMRADHPLAKEELTVERYAAADHLTVSRRGRLQDPVDDLLQARGLHRRVVAAVPTVTAALHFVRHSDLVAVVPEHMVRPVAAEYGLYTAPVPLDAPPVPLILSWHQRYDGDRAHAWLRTRVSALLREICAP
jgi:DNA-binding transcriptional LysR family regulator